MADLLPLLPWAPQGAQGANQDSSGSPAEQQTQDDNVRDLSPKSWRLLGVPTIHITPSSDGESPPGTPNTPRFQSLKTPDPECLSQDRSDLGMGWEVSFVLSQLKCGLLLVDNAEAQLESSLSIYRPDLRPWNR